MKHRVISQFRMEGGRHHVIGLDKNRIIIGVCVDVYPGPTDSMRGERINMAENRALFNSGTAIIHSELSN